MKVDSSTKVTSLNADELDGNDASAFLGVDDQAASATNADEVDNKDANELVRVASRETQGEERRRLWQRGLEVYPGWNGYERRSGGRRIPLMVLSPEGKADGADRSGR